MGTKTNLASHAINHQKPDLYLAKSMRMLAFINEFRFPALCISYKAICIGSCTALRSWQQTGLSGSCCHRRSWQSPETEEAEPGRWGRWLTQLPYAKGKCSSLWHLWLLEGSARYRNCMVRVTLSKTCEEMRLNLRSLYRIESYLFAKYRDKL